MKKSTLNFYSRLFTVIFLCASMLLSIVACTGKKADTTKNETTKQEEKDTTAKLETEAEIPEEPVEEAEPLPDFCTLIAEANDFTMEMMYGSEYLDYETPVTVKKTNDYGEYYEEMYLLSYPGINSIEEFRAELSKYYINAVAEEILAYDYWEEIEGKLYRGSNGIGGGPMPNNAKLIINKVDDNRYEITIDWFSGDVVLTPDEKVNYICENGSWGFDKSFRSMLYDPTFEIVCENAADIPKDFAVYSPIIETLSPVVGYGWSHSYEYPVSYLYEMYDDVTDWDENMKKYGYTLSDIDSDGTRELILGYCEDSKKGNIIDIFTIVDGNAVHLADSGERYMKTLLSGGDMVENWSGGAGLWGYTLYKLNDTKDGYEPYFTVSMNVDEAMKQGLISDYSEIDGNEIVYFKQEPANRDVYVPITRAEFDEAVESLYAETLSFELIPFSEYDPSGKNFIQAE